MEKTVAYVTTFDESKVNESINKIMEYCKHNQLNLKVVIQTNLEKIAFEPEKLVNELKEHRCDIVVSDDINLMFPDVEDFRVTFLEVLKRNGIECIHTNYGRPMLEMAHYVNMKRSEELSRQASNVKSLIVYKGYEGYKDEHEYLEMEEYVGSNLDSGEIYGVLYYQNESKEIIKAMRNIIANNPIEEVVLKEAFTTEEGIDFMRQIKKLGVELHYYEEISQEQRHNIQLA